MGFAPLKVEVFCWQLLRGRIAIKEQLARKGLLDWNLALCTFCKAKCESIGHYSFLAPFRGKYGCIAFLLGGCSGWFTTIR